MKAIRMPAFWKSTHIHFFPSGSLNLASSSSDFFIALPNLLKKRIVLWWFLSVFIFLSTYTITQTMNDEIDEVESLTAARAGAMAGTEPSDGLRVCCRTLQPFFFVHTII